MKHILFTAVIVATFTTYAKDCPKISGAKKGGKSLQIYVDKQAFEKAHDCKMTFKDNPEVEKLNRQIKGNTEKLPAVSERLPKEPLVIVPYKEIGSYGGTFNGISKATESGTSDILSVRHVNLTRYNDDLATIVPNVAKSWEFNDDFTKLTFKLRKGHKWSNGEPFTAKDVAYWYNNLVMDPKVTQKPKDSLKSGGEFWKVEAIDTETVTITTQAPQPGLTAFFAVEFAQPFQPQHLLSQFDPKVNNNADNKAKELGFKDAYDALTFYYGQSDWKDVPTPINKDKEQSEKMVKAGYPAVAPTLEAFIIVEDTVEGRRLVANPYFFQVDTAGNQLPYINQVKESFVGDEDIQTAKLIAGEVDYKAQAVNLPAAPVLLENRKKGKYSIALRPNIAMVTFSFNVNDKDKELRKIFNDILFRKAVSLGLNRNQMNEVGFLKLGKPTQYTVFDADTTHFVKPEQRSYLIEFNPKKARKLLNEIKLKDSDNDGVLELASGKKFELTFQFTTQGISTELAEVFTQNLTDLGIKTMMKEVTSDEYRNLQSANELSILEWTIGQPLSVIASNVENFKPPFGNFFAMRNGMEWVKWKETKGKEGVKPPQAFEDIATLADKFTTLEVGTPESTALGQALIDKWLEQLLMIGTIKGVSPVYYSNKLGNFEVPKTSSYEYYRMYPYLPTQWFIKK